ncbi:hypothetical protein [Nocardioides sp. T2.26MG-1]|uniref:hypothetical protein n=1 Tax=Nocardioides sp. T2.26MG-1 TaxID=3041166 RepID=UPI0024779FFD|nr:hypothetical protein [Nocardioides sp. T2.26MG-1]CAI9407577.1 hypothetical protein HIDPHFAB_04810 [Nocardioides sp. T2.26MG-1]
MTVSVPPSVPPPVPEIHVAPRRPWGAGRVVAAVTAAILLMLGVGMVVGGGALRLADATLRNDDGFVMGSTHAWQSPGYAVQSESAEIHTDSTSFDLPARFLGTMTATADPATPNGVFLGVARTADVERYLADVAHSTVLDPFSEDGGPTLTFVDGGSPDVPPTEAAFWASSASGRGPQSITWEPEDGHWTLVVMNGEGTTPVSADVAVGAEVPVLDTVGAVLLVVGLVIVGGSGIGLWLVVRQR